MDAWPLICRPRDTVHRLCSSTAPLSITCWNKSRAYAVRAYGCTLPRSSLSGKVESGRLDDWTAAQEEKGSGVEYNSQTVLISSTSSIALPPHIAIRPWTAAKLDFASTQLQCDRIPSAVGPHPAGCRLINPILACGRLSVKARCLLSGCRVDLVARQQCSPHRGRSAFLFFLV